MIAHFAREMMTFEADRRARWARTCADAATRGTPIESDPRFLEWIEDWICGAIDMTTVRQRYLDLLGSRSDLATASPASTFLDDVYDELPEVAGLVSRENQALKETTEAVDAAWTEGN